MIKLLNMDCIEYMATLHDKTFDLAIVDPPYGGGQNFNFRFGSGSEVYENRRPLKVYWEELFRVSKNQIVWGAQYFTDSLKSARCWICWFKGQPLDSFSDFELAWTSFDEVCKAINLPSYGFNHPDLRRTGQPTIHPTQKPVALYKWLLTKYAKPVDRILDTHGGSCSIAIAAYDLGFDLTVTELDPDYYRAAVARYEAHRAKYAPAARFHLPKKAK